MSLWQLCFCKAFFSLSGEGFVKKALELKVDLGFHGKQIRLIFEVRPEKGLFTFVFVLELLDSNFDGLFVFICRIISSSMTSALSDLACFLAKTLLL